MLCKFQEHLPSLSTLATPKLLLLEVQVLVVAVSSSVDTEVHKGGVVQGAAALHAAPIFQIGFLGNWDFWKFFHLGICLIGILEMCHPLSTSCACH